MSVEGRHVVDPVRIRHIVLICAVAYGLVTAVRLAEAARWDRSSLKVDGEYLLASNDAYAWVAGAEGYLPAMARSPLAVSLRILSEWTGASPAWLAFWLPPFLAGLVVVPVAAWAYHLDAAMMGLPAAVLTGLAPVFYTRSRLGFFDTDWATMFFPLCLGLLVAEWIRASWPARGGAPSAQPESRRLLTVSVIIILILLVGQSWHPFIGVYAAFALGVASCYAIWFLRGPGRATAWLALLAFALSLTGGWAGALVGLTLLASSVWHPDVFQGRWLPWLSVGVVMALLVGRGFSLMESYLPGVVGHYLGPYLPSAQAASSSTSIHYPSVSLSVKEMQQVRLIDVFGGLAFFNWLGLFGGLGFLLLLGCRPETILMLPLYLLGISSAWTGARFAMFAAAPTQLGLLVPIGWLLSRGWGPVRSWHFGTVVPGVLTAAIIPLVVFNYQHLPVDTVLAKPQAEALTALSAQTEGDGMVWTWWDYGYATNHFARLESLADGSRNSGQYLFALGVALGSDQLASSANLMRFSASTAGAPWDIWNTWSDEELAKWLEGQGAAESWGGSGTAQYLVTSWEAVKLLPWIQTYASWDFERQTGSRSSAVQFGFPGTLDLGSGVLQARDGGILEAVSVDLLSAQGSQHFDYARHAGGPHVLVNEESAEVLLLDDVAYGSTLVRLLIRPLDAPLPEGTFRLVVARDPGARVYRLEPFREGVVH